MVDPGMAPLLCLDRRSRSNASTLRLISSGHLLNRLPWDFLTSHGRVINKRRDNYGYLFQVFLTKRFDREGQERIHYASATTLLGARDFQGGSYLEIVEFINRQRGQGG